MVKFRSWRAFAALFSLALLLRTGTSAAITVAGSEPEFAPAVEEPEAAPMLAKLPFKSSSALVVDMDSGETIAAKNADAVVPIASLTKLMTALVVLDAKQRMDEQIEITADDVDHEKHSHSRLLVGTKLTRDQALLLALMASENRAALALSRNYPGGRLAFVQQMNVKAKALGMTNTHFADPAGLLSRSVSTARDLHRLVAAASAQPTIRAYSTQRESRVRVKRRMLTFRNSNRLVRYHGPWNIELQKTGYTNEAGRCLVMQARVGGRRLAMIFLDSFGKLTRYGDASRVRKHLEIEDRKHPHRVLTAAEAS